MDDLEKKQTFLRANILEKGYDAEEFMNFLQSKKGELGLDLNNWNINELNSAVYEFVSSINKSENIKKPEEPPKIEIESEEKKEEIIINLNNNDNINSNNDNKNFEVENNDMIKPVVKLIEELTIECEKVEPNELSLTKDVDIKLSFPQKMDGGLFSKSYVTYLIQTTPMDFKLRKRYSDFEWLKHILSIIYVNCVIPPLCKKNYTDRFSEVLIAKRTRSIEKFMKGILLHPLMKNDEVFYNFISTEKESDFEKKKKLYNKITSPIRLSKMKSLSGEINVNVSNDKEIYFENIKNNADLNISIFQKITKAYKSLMLLMDQVSEKMKEISQYWKEIYNLNLKFYEKPYTTESYNILSKIMQDWSETNKRQKILVNEDIREYFRYIKNEFVSMKDLAQKVEFNKNIYNKAFDKLISLKESTFRTDISNWGLSMVDLENKNELLSNKNLAFKKMLPRDTKKVDELRNYYGFYLNSMISEYERIKDLNNERHKTWVTKFIKNLIESFTDLQISLNDRYSYYDEVKEEIENINKGKKDNDEENNENDDKDEKNGEEKEININKENNENNNEEKS